MNEKIKIRYIIITYAILAVIPNVLGYLQYDTGESTPYSGGSCGSCHVVPDGSTSINIGFPGKINRISDPDSIAGSMPPGTEKSPIP